MKNLLKQYKIPLLCLLAMILVAWAEEAIFFDGAMRNYIYANEHVFLRSFIRVIDVLLLFSFGYIGLKKTNTSWIIQLWIAWYVIVLLTSAIRILPLILFHKPLPLNVWSFLNSFYAAALTPFPYIFLWMLFLLIRKIK